MRYSRPPSTMGTRIHGLLRWIVFVGAFASALATGSVGLADEPVAGSPANYVLHLADGGFVAGKFRETDRPGMLRWQGNAFTSPFDFNLKSIDTMQAPAPTQVVVPEGAFRIELSGGDVVFGTLVMLDDKEAELDLPRIGRLRIQRSHLLRLERWQGRADLVYLGPTGLTGWTPSPDGGPKAWREESGALMTDQEGASITSDIPLPARAVIEFELSWKNQPDFVLTLGGVGLRGGDVKKEENPFRFEVWEQELVVQRETPKEADVASLGKLDAGPGHVHLRVYFDDERGRLIVDSPDGKPLAELNVAASKPHVLAGFQLENKKGDVRLERLEITRWNGELLREPLPDGPNLRRTDGSNLSAKGIRFDAESKSFVVSEGDKESRIPLDETARLTFSHLTEIPARPINLLLQEGSRLSGDLVGVVKDALMLKIPGVEEPVRLPIDRLRSLVANHSQDASVANPPSTPRLEMDGVRLIGRLVDGKSESGVSCLTWQPNGSATASTLLAGMASGRILYKEPAPVTVTAPRVTTIREGNRVQVVNAPFVIQPIPPPQPAAPQGGLQGFIMAFAGAAQGRPAVASPTKADVGANADTAAPGRRALYLRTGDIIPAEVTKIDEKGVTIRTSHSKDAFVPHEKIKAVELSEEPIIPVRLNKAKRERLLTLPRVQKGSPPTHLIRSKNGDYLRGRVVGMDEKSLQVEVRLEVKTLPRDRVARIIWLQAEDLEAGKDPALQQQEPAKIDEELLVQALRKDGVRLTFTPDRFEGDTLTGTSRVLGECRVRLDEVDQLLIGKAIEKEAAQLTFQRWLLTDAPEPKVTEDDGGGASGGGGSSGLSSPLVGKPAPDFSLEQLGGKTFRLADAKGKVVVLDFWATWCGPCLQAMPQVEKVTGEFRDQGVMLVAVNLQESPKEISAMLERHKLNLTVALDKDGAVAEKYKANAIPQTVIIDREGNVTRLFVGGGPHLGDQLREAIQATLGGPDAKKTPVSGGTDPKEPAK
ncbi:TlpA family protein disulfide reductase [Singulisphaera acidiphila]|uniref:Thiol-disulfide isomerase-like thioredoxin n=1 Tax=Singulisphaera acidiphila (strain ATCC BAA-1392 / DSM 18658 / VKM B-2454 / MOB10) TaxID=886293 RepID=L0DFV3_SINAD|nr:TlpA disulfide reductase family protein [Singulisphaera acidiphila]AGA27735.1 thiol-disulfide isomerase-like thioredoxin [Singulisphaera acidiphila DSM 18658]